VLRGSVLHHGFDLGLDDLGSVEGNVVGAVGGRDELPVGAASANSAWAARHASASGGEVGNGVWAETMTVARTLAGQLILWYAW
jgi:hypothetical protein